MTIRLTLFTATLVQDSALSVSGLDREASADQPFAIADGIPTLVGRGLKGAAIAMARRFFKPLPSVVSDVVEGKEKLPARRSAWEFADATTAGTPKLRAGVGIRQKTGARAGGVLYDREIMPAGTRWQLSFRVDRSYTRDDAEFTEAEGILGYVLAEHWAKHRCWLGGGVTRGLGWCHVEELKTYRLDETAYEVWVKSDRTTLPRELTKVPVVSPTRSWCFRTLDVNVSFGEYKPSPNEAAWGLDMFTVGPHNTERTVQATGDGQWAKPAWVTSSDIPDMLGTDRGLLMDNGRPLLPGASVRGPLRHAYSRVERAAGQDIEDPHLVEGNVGEDDLAGKVFGTVNQSSRILIRDAIAEGEWAAAKLHMHAEDEFSAGSYQSAKRDAVRVLKGTFPVRIVVEGKTPDDIDPLIKLIDRQLVLGSLGHLFIGGHKTRGAGAGHWEAKPWTNDDVYQVREETRQEQACQEVNNAKPLQRSFISVPTPMDVRILKIAGIMTEELTLGAASKVAKAAIGEKLVAWWCDPTIDLTLTQPPATFGRIWPGEDENLHVDEIAFYAENAVWRAVRTSGGPRFLFIEELHSTTDEGEDAHVIHTPACLHGFTDGERPRFSSARIGKSSVLLREWHIGSESVGFTIAKVDF